MGGALRAISTGARPDWRLTQSVRYRRDHGNPMGSSNRQTPLRPLPGRLGRSIWLALLCVLALHPLAIANQQGSSGLAALLSELLCGCASCATETVALESPENCCEVVEQPASESECGGSTGCHCSHPDQVPLGESTPLARPTDSRRDRHVAAQAVPPEAVTCCLPRSGELLGGVFDACRPPPGRSDAATHERRVWATRERLARLATCLI